MTARYTIKRAFRYNYCLLRLTELQIYIIGLTGSDIAWANALEDEVDAEPAVSYLGINLANLQEIMLTLVRDKMPHLKAIIIILNKVTCT